MRKLVEQYSGRLSDELFFDKRTFISVSLGTKMLKFQIKHICSKAKHFEIIGNISDQYLFTDKSNFEDRSEKTIPTGFFV